MSSTDFFGYKRDIKPNGAVASSEYATLDLGGRMALVQTVTANYAQQVNAKFELGTPTLYWVTGQPQGDVTFRRLVGKGGFLSAFGAMQNACGEVLAVSIGLDGTGGCSTVQNSGGQGIKFSGGVPVGVSVDITAGTLEVSEGGSMRCASMTVG